MDQATYVTNEEAELETFLARLLKDTTLPAEAVTRVLARTISRLTPKPLGPVPTAKPVPGVTGPVQGSTRTQAAVPKPTTTTS